MIRVSNVRLIQLNLISCLHMTSAKDVKARGLKRQKGKKKSVGEKVSVNGVPK